MCDSAFRDPLANMRQLTLAEAAVWEERYPLYYQQNRSWYLFLPDYEAFPETWPIEIIDIVYDILKEHCIAEAFVSSRNYHRYVREAQEDLDAFEDVDQDWPGLVFNPPTIEMSEERSRGKIPVLESYSLRSCRCHGRH